MTQITFTRQELKDGNLEIPREKYGKFRIYNKANRTIKKLDEVLNHPSLKKFIRKKFKIDKDTKKRINYTIIQLNDNDFFIYDRTNKTITIWYLGQEPFNSFRINELTITTAYYFVESMITFIDPNIVARSFTQKGFGKEQQELKELYLYQLKRNQLLQVAKEQKIKPKGTKDDIIQMLLQAPKIKAMNGSQLKYMIKQIAKKPKNHSPISSPKQLQKIRVLKIGFIIPRKKQKHNGKKIFNGLNYNYNRTVISDEDLTKIKAIKERHNFIRAYKGTYLGDSVIHVYTRPKSKGSYSKK